MKPCASQVEVALLIVIKFTKDEMKGIIYSYELHIYTITIPIFS